MGRGESKKSIQKLPATIVKNGHQYEKVAENENAYLYKQKVSKNFSGYEVFIKKIKPERLVNGIILPAKEWFPEDEAFGFSAWSYTAYEKANEKLKELEGGVS